jgi:nucleotide-binding universal stress UspA family protein
MSIFPTKILLATDGSEEATLAARTAVDLAQKTGSELHVVHARPLPALAGYSAVETPITNERSTKRRRKGGFGGYWTNRLRRSKPKEARWHKPTSG